MTTRVSFPVSLLGVKDFHLEGFEKYQPLLEFSELKEEPWSPNEENGNKSGVEVRDPLLLCAYSGDVEGGKEAVHKGADVRSQDSQGICPLMIACQEGHKAFVEFLIEEGAIVTQQSNHSRTALFYAVSNNRPELARLILESDPDGVDMVDGNGMTVFMISAQCSLIDMVVLLHEFKADFNVQDKEGRTALMAAAQNGDLEMVTYLVDNGAVTTLQSHTGATALLIALSHKHLPVVEYLLHENVVNLTDNAGNSVLIISCGHGMDDIAKRMIEIGADVNHQNNKGITPMMAAVWQGQQDIIYSLIRHKSDMTMKNYFGLTAFDLALLKKDNAVVNQLRGLQNVDDTRTMSDVLKNSELLPVLMHLDENKLLEKVVTDKYNLKIDDFCNDHTPLMIAAHHNNLEALQILLKNGADVNLQSSEGVTALTIAIAKDHVAIFERLLEYSADINFVDNNGETMLFKCAAKGNIKGLLKLERMGANIDNRNNNGDTPLMAAAQYGHVDVVKYLWKMCAQLDTKNLDGCTALDIARIYEQHSTAALLHGKHDAVFEDENTNGQMLMQACLQAGPYQVTAILDSGAPANFRDPEHNLRTPLMCAAQTGDCSVVKALITNGASVHVKSVDSETPLIFAAMNGHTEVVECLISHGANVNIADESGHTPLMCCCQNGYLDIVKVLVKNRALLCLKDRNSLSALFYAVQHDHSEIVELLLQTGYAHVDTFDGKQRTSLFLCCCREYIETARVLLDHNADIDGQENKHRKTALMAAVESNNFEMVKFLVERGASLEKVDSQGNLAHEIADRLYLTDIHAYLVAKITEQRANRPVSQSGTQRSRTQKTTRTRENVKDKRVGKTEGERNLLDMCTKDWGFEDVVKFSVEAGADINCKDADGLTPILIAAKKGHFKYIPWLIKYNVDVNCQDEHGCTPLMYALRAEEYAVVFLILEGTSGSLCAVDMQDHMGTTALMISIQLGMYEIADKIIQLTVDVNIADTDHNTALFHCAMNPGVEPEILHQLLNKEAKINCTNSHGDTPLLLALRHQNEVLVRLLLEQNIDLMHKTSMNEDALLLTCQSNLSSLMNLLAPYLAFFEADSVEVALRWLVANDVIELLRILLCNGLDVNKVYRNRETLAFWAVQFRNLPALEESLVREMFIDHQNEKGQTLLMLACSQNDTEMVRKIIMHNANLFLTNQEGLTAMDIALANNQCEIICLFNQKLSSCRNQSHHYVFCNLVPDEANTSQILSLLNSRLASLSDFLDGRTEVQDLQDISGMTSALQTNIPLEEDFMGTNHAVIELGKDSNYCDLQSKDMIFQRQISKIKNSDFVEDFSQSSVPDALLQSTVVDGPMTSVAQSSRPSASSFPSVMKEGEMEQDLTNGSVDIMKPVTLGGNSQASHLMDDIKGETHSVRGRIKDDTECLHTEDIERLEGPSSVSDNIQSNEAVTSEDASVDLVDQTQPVCVDQSYSMGDRELVNSPHVTVKDPELHTEPTESRHQLIEKLKRDLQTREQVIQKQTEELIELQKQKSALQDDLLTKEAALRDVHLQMEKYDMGGEIISNQQRELCDKVQHLEQIFGDILSENQVLKHQLSEALEQEKALKEDLEVLRMELEDRDETIAMLQTSLKQKEHSEFDPAFTTPAEDKSKRWRICACKKDSCPTCVAEKAATSSFPKSSEEVVYWDDHDPDDTRAIVVFKETHPVVPGESRKFMFLFHMSISDSMVADHAHPECSISSISVLLFAYKHLVNPVHIYKEFVSDFLYEQVHGSIKEAKDIFDLNYEGRQTQLSLSDTVLVTSHIGMFVKEDLEMDNMVEETLLHYMMHMEDTQILLFYRMSPYCVYSIITVEGGEKILVLDSQWHSVKKKNRGTTWHGAILYYSERVLVVVRETINLLISYSGPLTGKCRLALLESQNN